MGRWKISGMVTDETPPPLDRGLVTLVDGIWWLGDVPVTMDLRPVMGMSEKGAFDNQPRRTLADVVANPPEGWEAEGGSIYARFAFDGAEVDYDIGLMAVVSEWVQQHRDTKTRAAAHRAVADLLDLLAAVSDG